MRGAGLPARLGGESPPLRALTASAAARGRTWPLVVKGLKGPFSAGKWLLALPSSPDSDVPSFWLPARWTRKWLAQNFSSPPTFFSAIDLEMEPERDALLPPSGSGKRTFFPRVALSLALQPAAPRSTWGWGQRFQSRRLSTAGLEKQIQTNAHQACTFSL